jgi:enolase
VSFVQENKEGLELLKTAIAKAGYTGKVAISSDDVKALCS